MALRVLFLPHGRRRGYFNPLMEAGVARRGWRVAVNAAKSSRRSYPFVRDDADFFALTDAFDDARAGVGNDAETASQISAAERATGIPVARLVLASERDMGRGFARPFFHFPERREVAAVLADNTLPQRMASAIFARMAEVLATFRPDVIVAGNVAGPQPFAIAMLARALGIPLAIGRPSKIHADRSFWTSDLAMLNEALEGAVEAAAAGDAAPDADALAFLAAFREKPRTIAYIARTWRDGAAESWARRHRYFADLAYLQAKHFALRRGGQRPKPVWPSVVEYYQTEWLARRQQRFFARPAADELARMRFVYLALHKEPELAINFQAVAWHNQYETAAKLAASLPYGVRLVVREHRFNRGRRPMRFYNDLAALPNTIIADPFDDQFKYISNASVIVTDNGSTGWEGLILGRTVVTLDRTFYDATDLVHRVYEPARLGEVLVRLLREPQPLPADAEARLARLVTAEFATTTSDDGEDGLAASIAAIEDAARRGVSAARRGAA